MNTNSRDLGIGAGKGDKSRVKDILTYRNRFPESMGPNRLVIRSSCCEAPFEVFDGRATKWHKCLRCGNACVVKTFEIT